MIHRTRILLSIALFAIIFLCSDFYYSFNLNDINSENKEGFINTNYRTGSLRRRRFRKPHMYRRPMCSGSGCSFYDKFGYYRSWDDFYEHNQYRFRYPFYPFVFSDYPNDLFY